MAGLQCGLGLAKTIFWGKDLAKPRLTFVFAFCPRGGGVWGGIRAGFWISSAGRRKCKRLTSSHLSRWLEN